MTKRIKPGQLHIINTVLYRAKTAENGCHGCDLNSIKLCPCITDLRKDTPKYDCRLSGIIFKKVQ